MHKTNNIFEWLGHERQQQKFQIKSYSLTKAMAVTYIHM